MLRFDPNSPLPMSYPTFSLSIHLWRRISSRSATNSLYSVEFFTNLTESFSEVSTAWLATPCQSFLRISNGGAWAFRGSLGFSAYGSSERVGRIERPCSLFFSLPVLPPPSPLFRYSAQVSPIFGVLRPGKPHK